MPSRWPASLENAPPIFQEFMQRKVFGVDDYPAFTAGFDAMNETIRATAARFDVPVIDLAAAIPSSVELMYDPIHFNEAGSRMAADVIAKALCE